MCEETRIDKYLWSVRLYKTRALSTLACKKGSVRVNDVLAKPSKVVRLGDVIMLKTPPIVRTFKVTGLVERRVSAMLARGCIEEITPESELRKLTMVEQQFVISDRGSGRPTKRDRRQMEKFKSEQL